MERRAEAARFPSEIWILSRVESAKFNSLLLEIAGNDWMAARLLGEEVGAASVQP